jgi:hypothetical protein
MIGENVRKGKPNKKLVPNTNAAHGNVQLPYGNRKCELCVG